jgi:hypothetical protein
MCRSARDPFDFAQGRLFAPPEDGYAQDDSTKH